MRAEVLGPDADGKTLVGLVLDLQPEGWNIIAVDIAGLASKGQICVDAAHILGEDI